MDGSKWLEIRTKRVHIGKPGQRLYLKAEEGGESVSLEEFIESREELFSIVVTERRPLFAMKFEGYEPNGNIQELRWKITNRAPKYYTYGYDPLNRVGGAGYGYFSNSNPGGGSASGGGITAVPSQEYSVLGISYDAVGNITDTGQLMVYDATGRKWLKYGEFGVTGYASGIEYHDGKIEAIYTPDGRMAAEYQGGSIIKNNC